MKKMKFLLVIMALVQLVACANRIDLSPRYDRNAKTLQVDTLVLGPVEEFERRKENNFGSGTQLTQAFVIDDDSCEGVVVQVLNPHANAYFYNSARERIMNHYDDSCLTRSISHVHSLRCMPQLGNNVGFYLTSSVIQHYGYGRQFTYVLPSNDCLQKFESTLMGKVEPAAVGAFQSNKLGLKESHVRSLVGDQSAAQNDDALESQEETVKGNKSGW